MLRKSWPQASESARLADEEGASLTWQLASEVAVEVGFNGKPWTVMMATPEDLQDLAIGLAWSEGVLSDPAMVQEIEVHSFPEGKAIDISIPSEGLSRERIKARTLEGRLGCGLCGVEKLADTIKPVEFIDRDVPDRSAIRRAFDALADQQPLFARTRSVHAAGLAQADGKIILVREDVGRHNALDKLIGACLQAEISGVGHFVVMTSRCSYELVQKAARFGVSALATISAPTTRAASLAREAGLALACQGPDGSVLFLHREE